MNISAERALGMLRLQTLCQEILYEGNWILQVLTCLVGSSFSQDAADFIGTFYIQSSPDNFCLPICLRLPSELHEMAVRAPLGVSWGTQNILDLPMLKRCVCAHPD